jgi:LacI family transcriptional regulator
MVTRNDVAKKAGVSTATVSRVLNGYVHVTPEIRKKVQEAVRKMDYRPNIAAKSLKTKKSYTIAYIVPDIVNPYYTEIYKGINEAASRKQYMTVIHEDNGINDCVQVLIDRNIDGIIINTCIETGKIKKISGRGIPVVLLSNGGEGIYRGEGIIGAGIIYEDIYRAANDMVNYLVQKGHSEIGLVLENNMLAGKRLEGYKHALETNRIPFRKEYIAYYQHGGYLYREGYGAVKELLERKVNLTAVITDSDLTAIGGILAAREKGLSVPQHLSFTGFDDSAGAAYSNPPLTSVKLLKYKKGIMAFDMLKRLMEGEEAECIELETEIIARESVRDLSMEGIKPYTNLNRE